MNENALPYTILINMSSGTASDVGEEKIFQAIKDSGLSTHEVLLLNGDDFFQKLEELACNDQNILVGGGDGSLAAAARTFLKNDKEFGLLPFGTMNMLAKDLDIPIELDKMFGAYKSTHIRKVDAATINDKAFFCAASLGVMPEASVKREETRDEADIVAMPKLGKFIMDEMGAENQRTVTLITNKFKRVRKIASIIVSNNIFVESELMEDNQFKKRSMNEGILGVYEMAPLNFWQKMHLLFTLQFGAWKKETFIREHVAKYVEIQTNNEKELVTLDGEPEKMTTPLKFSMLPKALKVIVPINHNK